MTIRLIRSIFSSWRAFSSGLMGGASGGGLSGRLSGLSLAKRRLQVLDLLFGFSLLGIRDHAGSVDNLMASRASMACGAMGRAQPVLPNHLHDLNEPCAFTFWAAQCLPTLQAHIHLPRGSLLRNCFIASVFGALFARPGGSELPASTTPCWRFRRSCCACDVIGLPPKACDDRALPSSNQRRPTPPGNRLIALPQTHSGFSEFRPLTEVQCSDLERHAGHSNSYR